MSTSTRFNIDVNIDQNNQLIISGNKRNGESAITSGLLEISSSGLVTHPSGLMQITE